MYSKINTLRVKKIVIISLALIFVLTGCFNKDNKDNQPSVIKTKNTIKEKSDLVNLAKKSKAVKCVISMGDEQIVSYTKGEKVRTEGKGMNPQKPDEIGYTLKNGDWMYTWTGKQGTKMNLKDMEEMTNGMMKHSNGDVPKNEFDWEKEKKQLEDEGADYNCQELKLKDDFFTPPNNVIFDDMNAKMKQGLQASQEMQKQFEAGEGIDMEKIKEMQKQYEGMNLEK